MWPAGREFDGAVCAADVWAADDVHDGGGGAGAGLSGAVVGDETGAGVLGVQRDAEPPVTDRSELQANVYNLLNRFYIDQPHPSHLIPGAGLSALIGANFRF